jgi:hypothetical protein
VTANATRNAATKRLCVCLGIIHLSLSVGRVTIQDRHAAQCPTRYALLCFAVNRRAFREERRSSLIFTDIWTWQPTGRIVAASGVGVSVAALRRSGKGKRQAVGFGVGQLGEQAGVVFGNRGPWVHLPTCGKIPLLII